MAIANLTVSLAETNGQSEAWSGGATQNETPKKDPLFKSKGTQHRTSNNQKRVCESEHGNDKARPE
jgi:hypothetical protein